MNIEIKRETYIDDKADKIRWRLQMRSVYKRLFFVFLIGAASIVFNIYDKDFTIGEQTGTIFIVFSTVSFFNILRERSAFLYRFQKVKKLPSTINKELVINIQEAVFKSLLSDKNWD
jgi:hypothetical protein